LGIEHLIQEAKERAAHRVKAFAAVGSFVGLGQKSRRQERVQQPIQLHEALLAEVVDAPAEVGEAGAPSGEEGRVHDKYIYLSQRLTSSL
jgi:hypothetical protein